MDLYWIMRYYIAHQKYTPANLSICIWIVRCAILLRYSQYNKK